MRIYCSNCKKKLGENVIIDANNEIIRDIIKKKMMYVGLFKTIKYLLALRHKQRFAFCSKECKIEFIEKQEFLADKVYMDLV